MYKSRICVFRACGICNTYLEIPGEALGFLLDLGNRVTCRI